MEVRRPGGFILGLILATMPVLIGCGAAPAKKASTGKIDWSTVKVNENQYNGYRKMRTGEPVSISSKELGALRGHSSHEDSPIEGRWVIVSGIVKDIMKTETGQLYVSLEGNCRVWLNGPKIKDIDVIRKGDTVTFDGFVNDATGHIDIVGSDLVGVIAKVVQSPTSEVETAK